MADQTRLPLTVPNRATSWLMPNTRVAAPAHLLAHETIRNDQAPVAVVLGTRPGLLLTSPTHCPGFPPGVEPMPWSEVERDDP